MKGKTYENIAGLSRQGKKIIQGTTGQSDSSASL